MTRKARGVRLRNEREDLLVLSNSFYLGDAALRTIFLVHFSGVGKDECRNGTGVRSMKLFLVVLFSFSAMRRHVVQAPERQMAFELFPAVPHYTLK